MIGDKNKLCNKKEFGLNNPRLGCIRRPKPA